MKVKYFAWVRERIGKAEETVEPPAEVRTVAGGSTVSSALPIRSRTQAKYFTFIPHPP